MTWPKIHCESIRMFVLSIRVIQDVHLRTYSRAIVMHLAKLVLQARRLTYMPYPIILHPSNSCSFSPSSMVGSPILPAVSWLDKVSQLIWNVLWMLTLWTKIPFDGNEKVTIWPLRPKPQWDHRPQPCSPLWTPIVSTASLRMEANRKILAWSYWPFSTPQPMIRASFGVWPPMASEALPVTHHFSWFDVSHMPTYTKMLSVYW